MILEKKIEALKTITDSKSPRAYAGKVCFNDGLYFVTNAFFLTYFHADVKGKGTIEAIGPVMNSIPPTCSNVIESVNNEKSQELPVCIAQELLLLANSIKANKKVAIGVTVDRVFVCTMDSIAAHDQSAVYFSPDTIRDSLCYTPTTIKLSDQSLIIMDIWADFKTIITSIRKG